MNGWAITLLSPPKVSYASTCQSIGPIKILIALKNYKGQTLGGLIAYNLLIPLTSEQASQILFGKSV